ncbi:MAG: ABC transporter permease [Bacteriovoracaceae bacterium]|nr:ABC transporter permease [Bacteriovoracaceae bacterium]
MFYQFFKYFLNYIFRAKTRQRLIFISIIGLFLSSFALLVMSSVMGGLQKKLIERSKKVEGEFLVKIHDEDSYAAVKLMAELSTLEVPYFAEYEIELLLKSGNQISPTVLHGLEQSRLPDFIKDKDFKGIILGADLGSKLQIDFYSQMGLISPAHTESFLGDIPRQELTEVSDFFVSELNEIDLYHSWTRLALVQNLIRKHAINRLRFYDRSYLPVVEKLLKKEFGTDEVTLQTWEDVHEALVWSLNLETTVMLILFISMSFLIAMTITSGFMIFFDKVKRDFASFWILGSSNHTLMRMARNLCNLLSLVSCLIGVAIGLVFLWLMDHYAPNVMPAVFVERKIPILITWQGIIMAFVIPYCISMVFSFFSLSFFRKENSSFLEIIRQVG